MIIQHNMTAANANRQLGAAATNLAKSTEKLSSGYRINRAADDAAGLAISEKMRGQIRGLDQASTNAQDGISMIQTAEGALSESQSILQRMRELSVQASNGTETDEDRANIQDEITQLQDELTRISTDTEFNNMKLLDGSAGSAESTTGMKASLSLSTSALAAGALGTTEATAGTFVTDAITIGAANTKSELTISYTTADGENKKLTVDKTYGSTAPSTAKATADDLVAEFEKTELADSFTMSVDGTGKISFTAKDKGANGAVIDSIAETKGGTAVTNKITATAGVDAFETVNKEVGTATSIEDLKDKIFEVNGQKFAYVDSTVEAAIKDNQEYKDVNYVKVGTDGAVDNDDATEMAKLINNKTGLNTQADGTGNVDLKAAEGTSSSTGGIKLQVGANEGQTMTFTINDMSAKALGVDANKVKVSTQKDAESSITTIDKAINSVSKERAKLGAVQNRLEHTISNLDTSSENLQTAESRIRDVNMADEMVNYSKHNILQQASQSMLAQAKNSTQGVLSLLQ